MKKITITLSGERIEEGTAPIAPQPKPEQPDELAFVIDCFRDSMRRYIAFRRTRYRKLGRQGKRGLFDIYHDLWNISGGDPEEAARLVDIHIREGFHSLRLHHSVGKGDNFRIINIEQKKQQTIR